METYFNQILDSPSKNSYIGSYYQPPERLLSPPDGRGAPDSPTTMKGNPRASRTTADVDSKAVIDALKSLQEKMRRLELERRQAERNVKQFSQAAHDFEHDDTPVAGHSQPPVNLRDTDNSSKTELVSKLQSAESRCQVLEKQLDFMRKMVEKAEKDKRALTEKQAVLQRQRLLSTSDAPTQREKLEKLEEECLKLNKTQNLAEMKIAVLEQKLLEEEHERKLVQEKAEEVSLMLQKELDVNLRLCPPAATEEVKPKRKPKKGPRKPSTTRPAASCSTSKPMPFVAGTSTSPSHSVRANMQSVLHLMKHHQPQLCERVRTLQRSGCGAKKSLRRALSATSSPPREPGFGSLDSLSDLLLALQDELGQMSFEHQELMLQIDATQQRELREDLERDLEDLVLSMEEKGAQITKLRKHQHTVHKLTQQTQAARPQACSDDDGGIRAPPPVRVKRQGRTAKAGQNHLQLLKETQKFRNSLKQDDLSWET